MSNRPDANLAVRVLEIAYEQRGKSENAMFHSDQGTQYAARKFRHSSIAVY
jgi:putative transposase